MVGSSSSSSFGSCARALAKLMRCCSPPDSCPKGLSAKCRASTRFRASVTASVSGCPGRLNSPISTVSSHHDNLPRCNRHSGVDVKSLEHTCRLASNLPEVCANKIETQDARRSRADRKHSLDDSQECGLARTVRARDADNMAGLNPQRSIPECQSPAITCACIRKLNGKAQLTSPSPNHCSTIRRAAICLGSSFAIQSQISASSQNKVA